MEDLIIRAAQTEDAELIALLLRELGWFQPMSAEPIEATTARIAHHISLCLADESHTIYVAVTQQALVGYVSVHWLPYLLLPAPEGFVSELFVAQAYRGQGIGKQLLAAVTAAAHQRGCYRLMLANSRERESYLRGFYQQQGWVERTNIANFVYRL